MNACESCAVTPPNICLLDCCWCPGAWCARGDLNKKVGGFGILTKTVPGHDGRKAVAQKKIAPNRSIIFRHGSGFCSSGCFLARVPWSLAGRFLVAVVSLALLLQEISVVMVLCETFTFSPAQWALLQLNGPIQHHSLVVDKTIDWPGHAGQ